METSGKPTKTRVVLFTGAGFSVPFELPTTADLGETLLDHGGPHSNALELFISDKIGEFWGTVFGWRPESSTSPTLEDHFTQIDLAANSGHHLGPLYGPKKLRALRKMTIHRIFTRL